MEVVCGVFLVIAGTVVGIAGICSMKKVRTCRIEDSKEKSDEREEDNQENWEVPEAYPDEHYEVKIYK